MVTIFHMNDLHGNYLVLPEVAAIVQRAREQGPVLVFDGGDSLSEVYAGRLHAKLCDLIGLTAWVPGNHDICDYPKSFANFVDETNGMTIASNLSMKVDLPELASVKSSLTLTTGAKRFSILGLLSPETGNREGFSILPPHAAVTSNNDERADLTIILSHLGYEDDVELARSLSGRYLILGGHSHTVLREPTVVNETVICQGGGHGKYLCQMDCLFSEDGDWSYEYSLIELSGRLGVDGQGDAIIEEYRTGTLSGHQIGYLDEALYGDKFAKNPVGTLVAKAVLQQSNCDVAIIHAAAVGAYLHGGPIFRADLEQMMIWDNSIYESTVHVSLLEEVLKRSLEDPYLWLHCCGLGLDDSAALLEHIGKVGDEKITIAFTHFLRTGGHFGGRAYSMLAQVPAQQTEFTTRNCTEEFLLSFLRKEPQALVAK